MSNLIKHSDAYKNALQNKDNNTLLQEKAYLTTAATSALLEQDTKTMRQVRACLADLSSLADIYDKTGKPGDRWRALGDVLTLALECGKPLEQLRLVLPSTICGKIVSHIKAQPGITPKELSAHLNKASNHISNEIKKLESAGLIYRLKRGRNYEFFMSALGSRMLDSVIPANIQQQQKQIPASIRKYPHLMHGRSTTQASIINDKTNNSKVLNFTCRKPSPSDKLARLQSC